MSATPKMYRADWQTSNYDGTIRLHISPRAAEVWPHLQEELASYLRAHYPLADLDARVDTERALRLTAVYGVQCAPEMDDVDILSDMEERFPLYNEARMWNPAAVLGGEGYVTEISTTAEAFGEGVEGACLTAIHQGWGRDDVIRLVEEHIWAYEEESRAAYEDGTTHRFSYHITDLEEWVDSMIEREREARSARVLAAESA